MNAERWCRLMVLALLPGALGGCAVTASRFLERMLDTPQITHAEGSLHAEAMGVHLIATMTWIKEGAELPPGSFLPVYSIESGGWTADFKAPESAAPSVSAWFGENGAEIRRRFDAMFAVVRAAFPDSGARRFRIYVIPPGSRIDRAWPQLATNERDLRMTFALPLPGPGQDPNESVWNVSQLIAHEFAHSYFWFHREHYRNNFSDEVVAYSVQSCVETRSLGKSLGVGPEFEEFHSQVKNLDPRDIYARFHDRYPDTYLALFVATMELQRIEAQAKGDPRKAIDDYCRTIALSGRDFTKPAS